MRFALSLVVASLLAGCSDGFDKREFPQVSVQVDSQSVANDSAAPFQQAIQTTVAKTIRVSNTGQEALKINGINWAQDADGRQLKNQYVEINWLSGVGADSFPWTVDVNNNNALTLAVEFTPPLGKPLDDFSESVLVIKTNALDDLGRSPVPEFKVRFVMSQDSAIPRVTPTSYNFRNATIAKGETQEFRIYNDSDLATSPFTITNVYLENPSPEFSLQGTPSSGTQVLAPGDPGYADAKFTVLYQPKDDVGPDTNAIIIQTDVGAGGTLRVPLSTSSSVGNYELSYSHINELDFSNVTQREKRSVQLTCTGPGTMAVKAPVIEPAEARPDYTVTAWIPATTAEGTDTQITSWPRGLQANRSIRFDVEFAPKVDGGDTHNGTLKIPFENPAPGTIEIDLLSGDPKAKIAVGPITELVSVTGATGAGSRTVVIYNDGNGPLQVKGATVHSDFDLPAKVWALSEAFEAFTVAPGELALLEVDYDIDAITDNDDQQIEYLDIIYFDDFTGADQKKTVGLSAQRTSGLTNPVGSLGSAADYASAVAGQAFSLNASGSTAASGAIDPRGYIYYLVAKPAGSDARFNVQSGASASFTADVAGTYGFELVVYAKSGDVYLYSAPVTLTVTVGAAP